MDKFIIKKKGGQVINNQEIIDFLSDLSEKGGVVRSSGLLPEIGETILSFDRIADKNLKKGWDIYDGSILSVISNSGKVLGFDVGNFAMACLENNIKLEFVEV